MKDSMESKQFLCLSNEILKAQNDIDSWNEESSKINDLSDENDDNCANEKESAGKYSLSNNDVGDCANNKKSAKSNSLRDNDRNYDNNGDDVESD